MEHTKKQNKRIKVKKEVVYIAPKKSKTVAAVLAFFLGDLGLHKFYLGKNGQGIIYLLLSLTLFWTVIVPFIITIVCWLEALGYLMTDDKEFAEKYR